LYFGIHVIKAIKNRVIARLGVMLPPKFSCDIHIPIVISVIYVVCVQWVTAIWSQFSNDQ